MRQWPAGAWPNPCRRDVAWPACRAGACSAHGPLPARRPCCPIFAGEGAAPPIGGTAYSRPDWASRQTRVLPREASAAGRRVDARAGKPAQGSKVKIIMETCPDSRSPACLRRACGMGGCLPRACICPGTGRQLAPPGLLGWWQGFGFGLGCGLGFFVEVWVWV